MTVAMKLKDAPWKKSYDKPRQRIKKQRHYFADKDLYSQSYVFSSSHVWLWELDNKKGWAPKNWCFRTVVLEKTLESPLDCKEIRPVNPKGNQPWIFIGRIDAETEGLMLKPKLQCFGHLMWSSSTLATWCKELTHWKRPWCWERCKAGGAGDDRGRDGWMASQTPWMWVWANSGSWWWRTGDLACCSLWGVKELDMTERLNK